jgi:hypothetical protein
MKLTTIEVSASALDSLREHYKGRTCNVFKKSFIVIKSYGPIRYKLKEVV